MEKLISCEYNMDNACVELCYVGGTKIAIDNFDDIARNKAA